MRRARTQQEKAVALTEGRDHSACASRAVRTEVVFTEGFGREE